MRCRPWKPPQARTSPYRTTSTRTLDTPLLPDATVGQPWTATLQADDADGNRFSWELVDAPAGMTLAPSTVVTNDGSYHNSATLSWTPAAAAAATTDIVVRVVDSRGGVTLQTFEIAVAGGNHAPTILPVSAVALTEGQLFTVPLVAADADGDPVTLTVRNLPAGARFDAATGLLSWTPGYDQAGAYKGITVVASDGKVTVVRTFDLVVGQGYADPVFTAVPTQTLREGDRYALQLAGSLPGGLTDADGSKTTLTYSASWLPAGATLDTATGLLTWTPAYNQHGSLTLPITLTATRQPADGSAPIKTWVTQDVAFNVLNANGAPQFDAPQTWNVLEGQMLRISVFAFDPDNADFVPAVRLTPTATPTGGAGTSSVAYSLTGLPPGATFDPVTLEIVWTPGFAQAGTYSVVVTATDDGDGTGTPLTSTITLPIIVGNANQAPVIGNIANAIIDKGTTLDIPVVATDADGDPVMLTVSGLPPFASFTQNANGTGTIHFAPGAQTRGDYVITVTAQDDGDGDPDQVQAQSTSFVVTVRSQSEAPVVTVPPQSVAVIGQQIRIPVHVTDLDQDALNFAVAGLPDGARIETDPQYGIAWIVWTPTADQAGLHDLSLSVTDQGLPPANAGYVLDPNNPPVPNVTVADVRIVVRAADAAPQLIGIQATGGTISGNALDGARTLVTADEGVPLTLELSAQDTDLDIVNWTLQGAPAGMTVEAVTGNDGQTSFVLRWTPGYSAAQGDDTSGLTPGHYHLVAQASDGSAVAARTIELVVRNTNLAPRIPAMPLQMVQEGQTLSFSMISSDPDGDAVHMSLVQDENTPAGVSFNESTGQFEWTPGADSVDNAQQKLHDYRLTFAATDGSLTTLRTVTVRVADVDQLPEISAASHALLVGQDFGFDVVKTATAAAGALRVSDADGAAQTQALVVSFSNLPEGARYDASTGRFSWTPGPGEVGDFVVLAQVSDGLATVTQSFTLRVVADAASNAPSILVDLTPSTPVLPGQTVLATVRSDGWSPIATTVVEVRGAAIGSADWQAVAIDATGRLKLAATAPGLVEIRVTVTDVDGFTSTKTQTVRVRDPQDTTAPVLAWGGMFSGSSLASVPATLSQAASLQASLSDLQLMGWKLEIAPSTGGVIDASAWTTLSSATLAAASTNGLVSLATLDPALLANGVYAMRLTAWDVNGRTSEIDTRVVVDSTVKHLSQALASDATFTLGGHDFALTRELSQNVASASNAQNGSSADFGNWTLPVLDTHLTTDQDALTALGGSAPWLQGARVWLQVPTSLTQAGVDTKYLSFTLTTQDVALAGNAPAAPVVTRTSFTTSDGWTLSANDGDATQSPALKRQGLRLYDQVTGLPWQPQGFVLTSPDGTRYMLDAQGRIQQVAFADGQQWLVSDAGIALVGSSDPTQRIEFRRDDQGRIDLVTGPQAGNASSINYGYDAQGRLVLARALYSAGTGTQYGYHADGSLIADAVTANLGTAVDWTTGAAVRTDSWSGSLTAGTPVNLSFTVRQSELDSTVKVAGSQGAVIIAVRTMGAATVSALGATMLGQAHAGNQTVTLLRITEAGLKLLTLQGDGAATAQVSLAGDLDHDGDVDGADSALFDQAVAGADLNGDGSVTATDRQILFADYGWRANQAPVTAVRGNAPFISTHAGLAASANLDHVAQDFEGDGVFWHVIGSTHGTAALSADGKSLVFKADAGFAGLATVIMQADDGYTTSAPIVLQVKVSNAALENIHVERLPVVTPGGVQSLKVTGDFTDAVGVPLPADYLSFTSSDPAVLSVDAQGFVHGQGTGTAIITVTAKGVSAFEAIAVSSDVRPPVYDDHANELNLYPIAIDLPMGVGQRQVDVHALDGSGFGPDLHLASSGTQYFISDPRIASISADGLVTAKASGVTTITVTNGGVQGTITLRVEPANVGPTVGTPEHGLVTQDTDGNTLMIGTGGLLNDTIGSIHAVSVDSLGIPPPGAPGQFDAYGAVQIDLGGVGSQLPLQLALKVNGPIDPDTGLATAPAVGSHVFFWQKGTIMDASGVMHDTWWLMDDGVIGSDGLAHTSSQPYVGMTAGGSFIVTSAPQVDNQTGAVKMRSTVVNMDAIWQALTFMAMQPTAFMAMAALSAFSQTNYITAGLTYTIQGSYQLQIPKGALMPDSTIDIPAPPETGLDMPVLTHVDYNPNSRLLTVAGNHFVPAGQLPGVFKYKVWLIPTGDQVDAVQKTGDAPVNGGIWQAFDATVQADGTLQITVPKGVSLSQEDVYVERDPLTSTPPGWFDRYGKAATESTNTDILPGALAYAPERGHANNTGLLNQEDANRVLSTAEAIWLASGVSPAVFNGVQVMIEDDDSNSLAFTSKSNVITLSRDGAGWGWYVGNDGDFSFDAASNAGTARPGGPADDRIDLLTVLMQELGAIAKVEGGLSDDDVVSQEIPPGTRRMPDADDVPNTAKPKLPNTTVTGTAAISDRVAGLPLIDAPVYSNLVNIAPFTPSKDTLVTTANAIYVYQPANVFIPGANPQPVEIGKLTFDNFGNDLQLSGDYTQQIVFSDDGTLAFIAGRGNRIYVYDTVTQDIVANYQVQGANSPISALAINDGWLYIAEGSNYGKTFGRLLRININPGKGFLSTLQEVEIPFVHPPMGYRDIAISGGRYLAVTAPAGPISIPFGPLPPRGDVYVIDLALVDKGMNLDPSIIQKIDLSAYPTSNLGKGPLYISAGGKPGQFLVSNAKDQDHGLAAITVALDKDTGRLEKKATINDIWLTPADKNWLQAKDMENIQRSAGTVIVNYDGEQYAFVADFNLLFNDPHFTEWDQYGLGKQIGGKIGIIRDPFGVNGTPTYLGATTPIPGVSLNQLRLDSSGMLYATSLVEDTSGHYTNGYESDLFYNSMFVWNASQLIEAALDAEDDDRGQRYPIDQANGKQMPEVTPARYDVPVAGAPLFGAIYGTGGYNASQTPNIDLLEVPDLKALAPSAFVTVKQVPHPDPVVEDPKSNLGIFFDRELAHLQNMTSGIVASYQAFTGKDNSEALASMQEAQRVLATEKYNFDPKTVSSLQAAFTAGLEFVDGVTDIAASLNADVVGIALRDAALLKGKVVNFPAVTEFLSVVDDQNSSIVGRFANATTYIGYNFIMGNPAVQGVVGAYKFGSALGSGNMNEALRQAVETRLNLQMAAAGEKPTTARELQLANKNEAFRLEQNSRGVVDKPVESFEFNPNEANEFLTETVKKSGEEAAAKEDARAVTAQQFAEACGDNPGLEINEDGSVKWKFCFAAGTLIHTEQGLKRIEDIRAGDRVVSQPEEGGDLALRTVLNTRGGTNKKIWLVQLALQDGGSEHFFVTDGHPIYVEEEGWIAVKFMEPGHTLQLRDGSAAKFVRAMTVYNTQHPGVACAADADGRAVVMVDVSTGAPRIVAASAQELVALQVGEQHETMVHNFEVNEFHTYYIGEAGVWVHNVGECGEEEGETSEGTGQRRAIDTTFDVAGKEETCFEAETLVLGDFAAGSCEICYVEPGDLVLARNESTGEQALKKVVACFRHETAELFKVYYNCADGPEPLPILTTENHPFWVEGTGWMPAGTLQPGAKIRTHDGFVVVRSARLAGVKSEVFNIEVEDFHSYFVGPAGLLVHNKNESERAKVEETPADVQRPGGETYKTPDTLTEEGIDKEEKPGKRASLRGELDSSRRLNKEGVSTAQLAEAAKNVLGKLDSNGERTKRPDTLIDPTGKIVQEDGYFKGETADYFTPESDKPGSTAQTVAKKSQFQASTVVVNLRTLEANLREGQKLESTPESIKEWVDKSETDQTTGKTSPPSGLLRLIVITKDAVVTYTYPESEGNANKPQYGWVNLTTGETGRLDSPTDAIPTPQPKNEEVLGLGLPAAFNSVTQEALDFEIAQARRFWVDAGVPEALLASVSVSLGDLPNGVAGQASGAAITLSPNGAGWGWYVAPAPSLHGDFQSTGISNEFEAKPQSDAANKLDLLTVIIHEMGHVIGLDDAQDITDVMDEALVPGLRRLPNSNDIVKLSALLPQLRANGLPAGAQTGRTMAVTPPTANPSLQNGTFGSSLAGWDTAGTVRVDGNGATLFESGTTSQTHLSQAFDVTRDDLMLSFTVGADVLRANAGGPGDAFEVSLLDAATGLPIGNVVDMTHTDALLNVQDDGTERDAAGMRKVVNADGSATYFVSLPAEMAGRAVYLSFDLLGFGQAASSVTVRNVELMHTPLAHDDTVSGNEDTAITGDLLANDITLDATAPTLEVVDAPQHGTVTLTADGHFTYTPAANYNGTDTFTYRFTDADGKQSNIATVSLTVNPVDDAPVVPVQSFDVTAGKPFVFDPLSGAVDVDGDAMTVVVVSQPAHGALVVNADGTRTYTADAGYVGDDSFKYTVTDGQLSSDPVTIHFTVSQSDVAPVAHDGTVQLNEDGELAIDLSAFGVDANNGAMTSAITLAPGQGALVHQADGSWLYTPAADFNGTDTLRFTLTDNGLTSNEATLTIVVLPVNDAPVLSSSSATLAEDTVLNLAPLATASDVDGDALTPTIVTGPAHGTLTVSADGTFKYTPTANFNGSDSFTYKVNDGTVDSNVATFTLTVTPVNDAPVLANASATLAEDGTLTIDPLASASDVDDDVLMATIVTAPAHGTLTVNADGSFKYTPAANFNGTDSFAYQVSDGTVDSNIATFTLTTTAVNDAPVLANASATLAEDTVLNLAPLATASDVDGDALTATIVTGPAHGTLTVNADGTFKYTPTANFNGPDSFTYKVNDGTVDSNIATFTLTVTPVNHAPVLANASATLNEDGALVVDPLASASDVDGDVLVATIVTGPAHGTLAVNADGTFKFTPAANFNGTDSFAYKVSDGRVDSNIATFTLRVTAVNDAPVLSDTSATLAEDTFIALNPLAPAFDVDGDALTAVIVTGPMHGSLVVNPDGTFKYTPAANFNGTDSFTYKVNDGSADSNIATFTLTVTPVNDAPVLANASATLDEDNSVTINPLATASDVDGDTLVATIVTGPAHGTLTVNADGSFKYTPVANFNGTDSFSYKVNDGTVDSNIATFTLTVTPVNDAPTLANVSATLAEDNVAALNPLAAAVDVDGDALKASIVTGPTHGTLVVNADGTFKYTPTSNFNGTDSFTYKVNDGTVDSNVATFTLTVTPVNDAPVLANASATLDEDNSVTINPLATASDVDGDTLVATIVTGPAHGTLTVNADGSFKYTPVANFNGTDSFSYKVNDGTVDSNIATFTLTVTPVNDAPTLANASATLAEDNVLTLNPLATAVDIDGDVLHAAIVTGPTHGTLVVNADGTFKYTPTSNFNGTDSFTYKVNDGTVDSNVATFTLTVTPVNDAPVLANASATLAEDNSVTINPLATASDVDGDTLKATIVTGPAHGTLTVNADGSFKYTPVANFNGTDSFSYKVNDGTVDSNIATFTLTVTPVNDAPTLANASATLAEDNVAALNPLAAAVDVDGDALKASIVTGPTHGTLVVNADGTFKYTPTANFNGTDSFTYKVNDGTVDSNIATFTLTVTPVNDAPTLANASATLAEDGTINVNPLTTATDVDGDVLHAAIVTGPAHGTLTVNADGTFKFTPVANFNGTDSFTYKVNDGTVDSNIATFTLTVTPVNDAPTLANASATLAEDNVLTLNPLATAVDVDGDTLHAAIVTGPTHGTLVVNADGTFKYTPTANFNGTDSFTYKVNDGTVDSNIATFTLTVTPVNDAPTLANASATLAEDGTINVNPLATATDVDGDVLHAAIVTGPTHGTLVVNADGTFKFTPAANFNGTDSFSYKVNDGTVDSNIATFTLTVTPVNDAPTLTNASATLAEDNVLTLNPLATAVDVDGDALKASIVTGPTHGTLVINADGTFKYTPTANFNGTDSFTYKVNDGTVDSNIATFTLTVTPVNDAPVLANASATLASNGVVTINPLATASDVDGDVLHAAIVTGPAHGTLVVNADGTFKYTPTANFSGSDSFTYKVNDGKLDSNIATFTLTVTAVNRAPVVTNASATLAEDTPLAINPLATATDADGDALKATIVTGPSHGTLAVNADGTFKYVPTANYNGVDSFTFKVNDGKVDSNVATFSLTVTPVNDAPVLANASVAVAEDNTVTINPLATASDVDGDTLKATVVTGPTHGTVTVNADGTFKYTPVANFNGSDSFTYKVNDGKADSNVATFTLTVTPVNDAPVVADQAPTVAEDGTLVFNPLATASDVDGDTLTASVVTGPAHGSLVVNANGTFSYKPTADYNGADTFTWRVSDGTTSTTATARITVTAVNDVPTAVGSKVAGVEDTALALQWSHFAVADVDSTTLTITITALPADGTLQRLVSGTWTNVAVGAHFVAADFAGNAVRFVPAANASGGPGGSLAGYGNRALDYARIGFTVSDGQLNSAQAYVVIDIAAVADAPTLALQGATGVSKELFRTGFEGVANNDTSSTLQSGTTLEGWTLVTGTDKLSGGTNGFEVWSTGDLLADPTNATHAMTADAGDGKNWLELNDAGGSQAQTLGIQRSVQTVAGASYSLSLDLAGRNGYTAAYTKIGVYVDGVEIATFNNTSASGSLSWTSVACSFVGTGALQNVRIVTEGTNQDAGGRGMMVDNIALTETIATNKEVFRTGWESAANADTSSTLVTGTSLEGWNLLTTGDKLAGGSNGFEVWSTGDQMADANNTLHAVSAAAGDGKNWLELNDASGTQSQTLGIQRSVQTVAGDTYTLSFDLAGRNGFTSAYTQIAVYVDGVKVATRTDTSGASALTWGTASVSFTGTGGTQDIRIVTDSSAQNAGGRGMMLDNIALTEAIRLNEGKQGGSIALQGLVAGLVDNDGSETLALTLTGMPIGSVLSDGTHSFTVTSSALVADLTGWSTTTLSLRPPASFSGHLELQAQATAIELSNGSRASTTQLLEAQVDAVAQAPKVALAARQDTSVSRELVATSWESACDNSSGATVAYDCAIEGWNLVAPAANKYSAFEFWGAGDTMKAANGASVKVQPASGNGNNWLSLTNGVGANGTQNDQTLGVEHDVATVANAVYTLTLDYAGALGLASSATQIGIYVDGVRIATYANTSANTGLNWQALTFSFLGNGSTRAVSVVLEGGTGTSSARGAMIDDLRVVETLPDGNGTVYGIAGTAIALPRIDSSLLDNDGSSALKLELLGVPAGSVLSDGTHTLTLAQAGVAVDVSGWDSSRLSVKAPSGFCGTLQLQARATSTESSNGSMATTTQAFAVNVLSGTAVATPAAANPYVTLATSAPTTTAATAGVNVAPQIVVGTPLITASGQLTFVASPPPAPGRTLQDMVSADQAEASVLTSKWMAELEAAALANWSKLMGQ